MLHPNDDDRRVLVNVAYRMLGSHADATDAVGDALARWYAMDETRRSRVESTRAWLITTVSRICLDVLRSARVQRETYVGVWLPEPAPRRQPSASLPLDPLDQITLDESVSMALLVVLETLTPAERVVFVLHDIFRYPFKDIGEMVGRSPEACRQLARSARRRLDGQSMPRERTKEVEVIAALKRAWELRDLPALIGILDPSVTALTDGGGEVAAAIEPVFGAADVGKILVGVPSRYPGVAFEAVPINGELGLAARDAGGSLLALVAVAISNDMIQNLWILRNPNKLRRWV